MTARLPTVGGDSGNWGDILNDFLNQAHNPDGSLKPIPSTNIAGLGVESSLYIPGIVADGGITDNYAVINTYLQSLTTYGGQNNLVLPPGFIGLSTELVLPLGVTLRGSGSSNSIGGFYFNGSTLCPMKTGTAQNSIVRLGNRQSGVQDLNICARNPTTSTQTAYALIADAYLPVVRNVGIYQGTVAAFKGTSNAVALIGSDIYLRSDTAGALSVWNNSAGDWQVTNMDAAGSGSILNGGQCEWVNCHFSMGPGGTKEFPLITDGGANTFSACYLDTITSSGVAAMIDRTAAVAPSIYTGCRWIQNSTNSVTGVPVIQEASNGSNGVQIIGGTVQQYFQAGSLFTYFIKGVSTTTSVIGVVCTAALSVGFSDAIAGIGTLFGNTVGITAQSWQITPSVFVGGAISALGPFLTNNRVAYHNITKTSAYTTVANDMWVRCTANSFTLTLGTSAFTVSTCQIITNEGAGTITMAAATGSYIGPTTIEANHGATFLFDGTNWHCVGSY